MYIVLKLYSNWADEFDVESFVVVKQEVFNQLKKKVNRALENVISQHGWYRLWFGTNECLEFPTSDDYWSKIENNSITEQEAKTLFDIFSKTTSEFDISENIPLSYGTINFFPLDDYSEKL